MSRRLEVRAPFDGVVRLVPPRTLAGELEVFEAGEALAVVDARGRSEKVTSPCRGVLVTGGDGPVRAGDVVAVVVPA